MSHHISFGKQMHFVATRDNFGLVKDLDPVTVKCMESIDPDQAFWMGDFNSVRKSIEAWEENLSDVKIHYAVKCCDEPQLLKFLADRGCGFDCASLTELQLIINLGVDANRIVFSHPIKSMEAIKYAKEAGVQRLVFDTEPELRKIIRYYPDAEVYMRIKPRMSNAKVQLSNKFGAENDEIANLLSLCAELSANFIGFSFHVGSFCDDICTFRDVLEYVSDLKGQAETLGLNVCFIDIGGGFLPLSLKAKFKFSEVSEAINSAILDLFGDEEIEFIGEPGRFIANDYLDLVMPVISIKRRKTQGGEPLQHIYIPDGIYGAFSCIPYDNANPFFEIRTEGSKSSSTVRTTLWGQTCDSYDVIYESMMWPELEVGDLVTVRKFGAYTYAPTSFFNGFKHHKVFPINLDDEEE